MICLPGRSFRLARRKWFFLPIALSIVMFLGYNVANKDQQPTTPKVEYDDQVKAHFVRPSSFRENPDVEFEAKLDAGLRDIERRALANGETMQADKVIWQITLGEILEKSPESAALEERNEDWTYKVWTLLFFFFFFFFCPWSVYALSRTVLTSPVARHYGMGNKVCQ